MGYARRVKAERIEAGVGAQICKRDADYLYAKRSGEHLP
jgi:hypothetical protein